jgi:cytochrome c oxidase cbb3-type subunit I/II
MWAAGLTEGLMWRALDDAGQLKYPNFVAIVDQLHPFYWMRLVGGTMYLVGAIMLGWNFLRTIRSKATVTTGAAPAVAAAS